jgi:benzodiazapine receptor
VDAKPWLVLILFFAICLGAGGLGSFFTASSVRDWYPRLRKPPGTPPSWVFGPVWTTLYVLMAHFCVAGLAAIRTRRAACAA